MRTTQTTKSRPSNNHVPGEGTVIVVEAEHDGVMVPPVPADNTSLILDRLLRMADKYQTQGSLWQAEEMYGTLMDDYPDTPQGAQARERMMDLCEAYELDGQLHHARSLYERLL